MSAANKPPLEILRNGEATKRAGRDLRQAGAVRTGNTLAAYCPFPIETLPAPLSEYVRQGAAALGCDPSLLALPVLAVVASAIGNTRTMRMKLGWDEACVIWSAIIGDSGTLKSPAYMKAVGCLFARQRRLVATWRKEIATVKAAARRKGNITDGDRAVEGPVLKRVVCSDITVEKLAEILENNPRGILVVRDELAGWLGSFTRYKGKAGGTDLPNWLAMHNAGTVIVDRKTGDRPTLFIDRAAVSVTGGIQPGPLARALTPAILDAGGGARLLLAMPPKRVKRWTDVESSPEAEENYEGIIDKLLALDFGCNGDGEDIPHALRLSREAKDAWIQFYNEWAKEQGDVEGDLAAAFSKLEGAVGRFALIHHVVTHVSLDVDDCQEVGVKSLKAGIGLCRWFAGEARRIYATLSESQEQRDRRRLVEFVMSKGGSITVRALQNANSRKFHSADDAEQAMEDLIRSGLARWVEGETPQRGGHHPRTLELLPTHDTSDTRFSGGGIVTPQASDTCSDSRPETVQNRKESARVSEVSCVGSSSRASDEIPLPPGDREQVSDADTDGHTGAPPWKNEWTEEQTMLRRRLRNCQDDAVRARLQPLAEARPQSEAEWVSLSKQIAQTEHELRQQKRLPPCH